MAQFTIELTPEEEARLRRLAQRQGREPVDLVHRLVRAQLQDQERHPAALETKVTVGRRIAGLHRGKMKVSSDFDAPLPDEFWTGEA